MKTSYTALLYPIALASFKKTAVSVSCDASDAGTASGFNIFFVFAVDSTVEPTVTNVRAVYTCAIYIPVV